MPDQHTAAREHSLTQELLAARDALPDDPTATVDDPQFSQGRRGYERSEVDAYVRRVTGLVRDLVAVRSPREAIRQALERVGDETTDILRRAHETSDEITSTSRREAEDRLEAARQEAEKMIADAEARVAELDRDADSIWQDRDRILADVARLSVELDRVRGAADERFPPDAAAVDEEQGAIALPPPPEDDTPATPVGPIDWERGDEPDETADTLPVGRGIPGAEPLAAEYAEPEEEPDLDASLGDTVAFSAEDVAAAQEDDDDPREPR